jgi:radical SAM superfamily enzyme YgiQ (UPF0313 family)
MTQHERKPVILVCPEISYAFPFSFGYLAGYLKQAGEEVRILFRPPFPGQYKQLVKQILDLNPILVGFGSLYPDLRPTRELIDMLDQAKRRFPIVIGGQMVSPIPEFALQITGADFGVIGEGEIILHDLVVALRENKELHNVRGLAIREQDKVVLTGPGPFIKDLSKLPPIPYELFPQEKFVPIGRFYTSRGDAHWHYNDRVVSIHGGRGCPYRCNFCYHHSQMRYRAISDMIREAEDLIPRYDANVLYFGDDLVFATPERAREMTDSLRQLTRQLNRQVGYSVQTRFDVLEQIDDDLLHEMKKTGCRVVGLGIESGSQRILDIMNKRITVDQIKRGLVRLKQVGIVPTVTIMVGQLSETGEDVKASIALMRESVRNDKNIQYGFTITTPYPGSPLYALALEKGYLQDHQDFYDRCGTRGGFGNLTVNFSEMSDEEVVTLRGRLWQIYLEEKERALGWKAWTVESARGFLERWDRRLNNRIFSKFPSHVLTETVVSVYKKTYDSMQMVLDAWRLHLRGICN